MAEEKVQQANPPDPSINVREIVNESSERLDDLRKSEVRRIDEKIDTLGDNIVDKIQCADAKYQVQFTDSKEAVTAALTATKEAINKADQANEKRFDAVNEFRSTLSDQQAKLLTRTEYDSAHKSLIEKIDGVENRINRTEGASNVYVTQSDLANAMDKLQVSIEATLRPVVTFMNSQTGQQKGIGASWGVALGIFGLVSTILGIFAIISRFLP